MSTPLIGTVIMFAGNFAPRGWALCQGQLLPIASNTALFSILGTTYGGDGRTTFGLPDLQGRFPLQQGRGAGLPTYKLGQKGGNYQTQLTVNNIPSHTHIATATVSSLNLHVSDQGGSSDDPSGLVPAQANEDIYGPKSTATMEAGAISGTVTVQNQNTGGSQAFSNMPPFLGLNFIIALQGIFPSRN
ncbi:phage tail protein [Rubritalea tangerina]|uniref:Phage tail protein n=1 Tax=Rubritalea tangerina TaxID=430798 RepID=A0ABW4ZF71_9BACT